MYISKETQEETGKRLLAVISQSTFIVLDGVFAFQEYAVESFPIDHIQHALAVVRDENVWSVLSPAQSNAQETFAMFMFHFPEHLDNSGFVGWLASHIKTTLGTGVFVVCGQNHKRGGIFDYWGVPLEMKVKVREEIEQLIELGRCKR